VSGAAPLTNYWAAERARASRSVSSTEAATLFTSAAARPLQGATESGCPPPWRSEGGPRVEVPRLSSHTVRNQRRGCEGGHNQPERLGRGRSARVAQQASPPRLSSSALSKCTGAHSLVATVLCRNALGRAAAVSGVQN
jgi:hypothetical protein